MGRLQNIVFQEREEPELEYEQIIGALRDLQRRDEERWDEERRRSYLWQSFYDIRPRFLETNTIRLPRDEFKTGNPTKICSNAEKANYIAKKVVIFRNKYLGVIVPLTKTICSPVTFLKHKTDNPSKIINQIIIQMNLFVIQNEFLFYLSKILKTDIVNIKMLVAYERNKVYLEKLAICMKKCKSQVNSGPKTIQLKVPKKDLSIYNLFHFMFEKHNIINDIDAIKTAKKAVILCSKLDYNVPKFDNKNIFNSLKMAIKNTEEAIRSTEEAINNYIINKQSIKESITNIKNKVISMEKLFQDNIDDCTCAICLEPLNSTDSVRVQCSHVYHKKCIVQCNRICPMCKYPITHFFYYV